MLRRAMVVLVIASLAMLWIGCGQTYELQSITISPTSVDLYNVGAQQAYTVTAHYSNSKTSDVTAHAKYQIAVPSDQKNVDPFLLSSLILNQSGILTVNGQACTFSVVTTTVGGKTTYSYPTDPFVLTATYEENGVTATVTSQVSVNNEPGCYDGINTSY